MRTFLLRQHWPGGRGALAARVPTAAARRNLQPDEICNLRNLDGLQPRLTGAGTTPEGFGRTVGL